MIRADMYKKLQTDYLTLATAAMDVCQAWGDLKVLEDVGKKIDTLEQILWPC